MYLWLQEAVASLRGLNASTIGTHLSCAIKVGLPVAINRLGITDAMEKLITDTIRKPPINSGIYIFMSGFNLSSSLYLYNIDFVIYHQNLTRWYLLCWIVMFFM